MTSDLHYFTVCKKIKARTGDLTRQGAYLVRWFYDNKDLDYSIHKMYVVKHDKGCYYRGQKLFTNPEGIETREIFFYNKNTRQELRKLIPIFDKPLENQIGFTKGKGIFNSIRILENNEDYKTFYTMDLSDAFNSITKGIIFQILHRIYNVNKRLSNRIAKLWTSDGHMQQGHPLAPLLFNLWSSQAIEFLNNNGVKLIQYADDLIIKDKYEFVSYKRLKFIRNAFIKIGFKINLNKCKFLRKEVIFLGLNLSQNHIHKRYKELRNIKHLKYISSKYPLATKFGKYGFDEAIIKGHSSWLEYNPEELDNRTHTTRKATIENPKYTVITKKNRYLLWENPSCIPLLLN
jgi:hypothetical protein